MLNHVYTMHLNVLDEEWDQKIFVEPDRLGPGVSSSSMHSLKAHPGQIR